MCMVSVVVWFAPRNGFLLRMPSVAEIVVKQTMNKQIR